MVVDRTPAAQETMLLLLQHRADPNAVDPVTNDTPLRAAGDNPAVVRALVEAGADIDHIQSDGTTALVYFVSVRQWDSALYLVQRGARLDVANEHGLSLEYYLKEWKDSVYGEHPEGWNRLRAAIAAKGKVRR
jgi:ankyrin repeat protein